MSDDDASADWAAWREEGRLRRQANKEGSTKLLIDHGVAFETKNENATHLVIQYDQMTIDFWPSTGLWIVRKSPIKHRGVFKLLRYMNVPPILSD